jgi:Fur family peroxide stress response transcriptional regulator
MLIKDEDYSIRELAMWTDPQARYEQVVAKLREQDFRLTPQRLTVVRILTGSKDHPSVEEIYSRVKADFPTTSLATVYKTLSLLKQMGEVMELAFGDGCSRYDGNNPHPHPHMICVECKAIVDPGDIETMVQLTRDVAQRTNFQILNHRLDFFGVCPRCQEHA